MIINKKYEINFKNIDEVFVTVAHDIENGFTIDKFEMLDGYMRHSGNIHTNEPSYAIILRNREVF